MTTQNMATLEVGGSKEVLPLMIFLTRSGRTCVAMKIYEVGAFRSSQGIVFV